MLAKSHKNLELWFNILSPFCLSGKGHIDERHLLLYLSWISGQGSSPILGFFLWEEIAMNSFYSVVSVSSWRAWTGLWPVISNARVHPFHFILQRRMQPVSALGERHPNTTEFIDLSWRFWPKPIPGGSLWWKFGHDQVNQRGISLYHRRYLSRWTRHGCGRSVERWHTVFHTVYC